MFDKEAITALTKAEATAEANTALLHGLGLSSAGLLALPIDFSVHDLEKHMSQRRRARGNMETSVLADFAAYAKAHAEAGATVLVSPDSMSAVAVLNLGAPEAPGQADNLATLRLKRTAAYTALLQIANGAGHRQGTIAEFLEDWTAHITCFVGSDEVQNPRATAAVRKITIEALRKQESSEEQLSASRSTFESVQANSGPEPLPSLIYFSCVPYQGLSERTFVMRLSVITSDKPALTLRIQKQEEHNEQMADELAGHVRECMEGLPVHLGTYSASR